MSVADCRMACGRPGRPHRWVVDEPDIPFELEVLYEDERVIVVDKPHFLPTTPRGMWYRSTALIRLRERYGEPDITPAHRLDRDTAGVVVFVRDRTCRGAYQMVFQNRLAHKTYECLAPMRPIARPSCGTVRRLAPPSVFPLERRSRIVKERGVLQAYEERGAANARTVIDTLDGVPPVSDDEGIWHRAYRLHPETGRTHQLRVHMNALGLPIMNDPMYPAVLDRPYDDFSRPLRLVARSLEFDDPLTGVRMRFVSRIRL